MNHNNVTTPLVAQGATDVQCRRNVLAMLPLAPGYRETIVEVVDTGRRRTRWMPAITGAKSMSYDVAIVEVPGQREPWEIAVERLQPLALGARERWLAMADAGRPAVQREEPKTPADERERRRMCRRRARLRQAGADVVFAAPVVEEPAPIEPRKRPSARARRRERGAR